MKKEKELRIIKHLPQIILPANKNEMFLNWYNEDLRLQDEIPKTFERGYIFVENTFIKKDFFNFSDIAKIYKTTYRIIEKAYDDFFRMTNKVIVYFEFKDIFLYLDIYNSIDKKLMGSLKVDLSHTDKTKPNPTIEEKIAELVKTSEFMDCFTYYCFVLIQCCLWYLATTTKTTKYYRENKAEPFYHEEKTIINPKKNKVVNTPIYDMNKIRKVKTESLVKRRKGWTYSHSFQVHGHYRHYANGKTIFINSFIKGKGKEQIDQKIILNPK